MGAVAGVNGELLCQGVFASHSAVENLRAYQTRNDCNGQKVFHQDYEHAHRVPPTIVSGGRVVELRMTSLECLLGAPGGGECSLRRGASERTMA